MKLIVLDRDGVINYDSDDYIKSVDEWIALPKALDAIARLSKAGWTVTVATNQSGWRAATTACPPWSSCIKSYGMQYNSVVATWG